MFPLDVILYMTFLDIYHKIEIVMNYHETIKTNIGNLL